MKFLIHGNAPWAPTGYGIQINHLCNQLHANGHDVAVSSTYGLQGGIQRFGWLRVYGCGDDYQSNDRLHFHAAHWFQGEPGWIIICTDVWAIENPLDQFNVAAWVPIDHSLPIGVQPNVAEFFERSGAVPIAMSRFGEDMLRRRGLDPLYVPLSVDTTVYKPTATTTVGNETLSGRQLMDRTTPIPDDAFVVAMFAMNKGWAKDRKGFNEALRAFGLFDRLHPEANAHLYMHTEFRGSKEGINLKELAIFAGIPEHKIHWAGGISQYDLAIGYEPEVMAALYSGIDVLLAPSHGEGFCVPIIEAHACGKPVLASNFSAQRELVPDGTGWLIEGQPEWDPPHHAEYFQPYIADIVGKLEDAYEADRAAMVDACVAHAYEYDTARVFHNYWRPAIADLTAEPAQLDLDRAPMPAEERAVAVICPIYKRTEHILPLAKSFQETNDGSATLVFVIDENDEDVASAIEAAPAVGDVLRTDKVSCAEKWNVGFDNTTEPWVLCIGDDVRFHEGWLDAARTLSDRYDVIGTNDSPNGTKNPKVASGGHADHFFVRRAYVDEYGASLDGPGILAPEAYRHWYVDLEIVKLAKARGVFTPCLDSIIEHLHPGYEGDEQARHDDPTYMVAVEHGPTDHATFMDRLPYIEQQRTSRTRI